MTVKLALDVNEQPLKTTRSQDNELPSSQERNHEFVEWKDDYVLEGEHESIVTSSASPALAGRRFFVENLPVHCQAVEDEAPSLCASSVSSSIDETFDLPTPRCVRFLDPLVSEVRYRPRTLPEDCGGLFYTSDETRQFRRDYHDEKNQEQFDAASVEAEQDQATKSYDISRVVIMANNSTIQYENNPWNNQAKIFESQDVSAPSASCESEEIFFDNDSFWTGSITWY